MKGVRVYIDEEYGYRDWVWKTGMTEEELVTWWKDQVSLGDGDILHLPGKVEKFDPHHHSPPEKPHFWAHLHANDDSYLRLPSGEIIYHSGYDGDRHDSDDSLSEDGQTSGDGEGN